MEANRPGVMSTQRKCIRRSQGCMAAQGIFHYRCEPTQVKIAISTGDHKGCFAVPILRCDLLHDIIGRKRRNEAYTRRITREQFIREGIDVVIRNWHCSPKYHGAKTPYLASRRQLGKLRVLPEMPCTSVGLFSLLSARANSDL